jgi:tricorn protease
MNSRFVHGCSLFGLLALAGACLAQAGAPLLAQKPALSKTHLVFSYAGDLWVVPRAGGEAKQLTTGVGVETGPHFSPDGTLIAFTGEYDGNVDVFVVPAAGGVPRRLTWHPLPDIAAGWTPDGKQILFRSFRASNSRYSRLFTLPLDGSFPSEVPLPMAEDGAYSPDGKRLAYNPLPRAFDAWKHYRGGRTSALWIADLADARIEKIPRDNSNDVNPMWVGDQIYFLSDRNGPFGLFAFDTRTKKVREVVKNTGLDFKSASAGPGAIVIEQFGSLHLYDLKSGQTRPVPVRLAGDLPSVRPSLERVANRIGPADLSPTGVRALFGARGEIFTVPAEKGDVRNLTNTPGVAERYPAWSPDGKRIACFSDESGEYALHLRAQDGKGDAEKIDLGRPPSYYYWPLWSPDSKKIAYTDAQLTVWYLDLEKKTPVKVDTDTYDSPDRALDPVWSPDGRWLAYTKKLKNHLRAVFVYSLEQGKSFQITDGMSDARYAAFDKDGKHLYFTASTDTGPAAAWLDMSSINRPVTRSVYVAVLRKDLPSPLAPESDEEKPEEAARKPEEAKKAEEAKQAAEKKDADNVRLDVAGISQRILALPIPARNYVGLMAGKAGVLFLVEGGTLAGPPSGPPSVTVHQFDLKTRKTERFLEGISGGRVSFNGEKVLYRRGEQWLIAGTAQPPKPGEGALRTDGVEMRTDPRAEWRQMYREAWRIERDFFYDPGAHGLDLKAAEKKYETYLERLGSRADLNYLFNEMLGELSVGHLYVGGGAMPEVRRVRGGLLGADYQIENGRYRFARVYDGENWNPETRAPLTQPGVNVVAGEYLLAVNGRELRAADNLYSFFEGTAGKSVLLRVGPDPGGKDARDVTVVPVESESTLRNLAWIEDNRRLVDKLSGGRLAYVYLPNTSTSGLSNFNRYYFAQVGKDGAVIDERFNGGGSVADYIIDYTKRPVLSWWTTRAGEDFTTPASAIFGPKVMIVNEMAGSGGDFLPWAFRKSRVGPLIGKRTWGGLVGVFGFPGFIDGGGITAPNLAFYNTEGAWEIENVGVPPDIEVEFDPQTWRAGHDPQLEKAVEVCLELLKKNPPPQPHRPAYPNYHRTGAQPK